MGCDMVVALGRATVDGQTLFGQNYTLPAGHPVTLQTTPGRAFAAGEKTRTQHVEVPQARQTCAVFGVRPEGAWGYVHGVNEHGVATGCTTWRSKIRRGQPGLTGPDLVRLALERSARAQQAVDTIAELVERHGQGTAAGAGDEPEAGGQDFAFLVADAKDAFLVEAAANYWVYQQAHSVRAAGNAPSVRQDWDRIARGLAGHAIEQGWWPGDGKKLDFADALGENLTGTESGLRRWGRATLLLEQQSGHIDAAFVRRVLSDHYEGTSFEVEPREPSGPVPLCRHPHDADPQQTAVSVVAPLGPGEAPARVVWCALGPPCMTVYFPLFLDGQLPAATAGAITDVHRAPLAGRVADLNESLKADPDRWAVARDHFDRLQARFDQEAEEFLGQVRALKRGGPADQLPRQATLFMQHQAEEFDRVMTELAREFPKPSAPARV